MVLNNNNNDFGLIFRDITEFLFSYTDADLGNCSGDRK